LDIFHDVRDERPTIHLVGDFDLNIPSALQYSDQRNFSSTARLTGKLFAPAFAHVGNFAADIGFVRFNSPEKLPLFCFIAERIRWSMNHPVFCVTPTCLLNQQLAGVLDLGLQAKQARWNVKGPHFISGFSSFCRVSISG
jgi:hypothetical protein